jgi:hypothetical protein
MADRKSYEEANWASLSPHARRTHNQLRMARGLLPITEPKKKGACVTADDPFYRKPTRQLRSFTSEVWERLPPAVRTAYNNLRRARFLALIPEPKIDLSPGPSKPAPKLLDPSPLARAIAHGGDAEQEQVLFEELKVVTDALLSAHDGNPRMLAERLRSGMATSEEMRLAADLIEDKVRRLAQRPATLSKKLRLAAAESLLRAWYHARPDRWGESRAVRFCTDAYHITRAEGFGFLRKIEAETVEHAEQGYIAAIEHVEEGHIEMVEYTDHSTPADAATAARAPEGFHRRTAKR